MTNGKCNSCRYAKRVYRRFGCLFWRDLRRDYCIVLDRPINDECGCAKRQRKTIEYDLSAQRFDEVENDIKFLLEWFKDA